MGDRGQVLRRAARTGTRVGATFTDDVHAYEMMKIRILNAGHQVLANAGELLSLVTIADCMAHPPISALFRKVQKEEIAPHVEPVPGMTPAAYVEWCPQRDSNSRPSDYKSDALPAEL
jgi:mannitol 2-dehydrogenase